MKKWNELGTELSFRSMCSVSKSCQTARSLWYFYIWSPHYQVEQSFPSLLWARCLQSGSFAHLSPLSVTVLIIIILSPLTFCSSLVLQYSFLFLLCQEVVSSRALEEVFYYLTGGSQFLYSHWFMHMFCFSFTGRREMVFTVRSSLLINLVAAYVCRASLI